jgi:hypothetical protein
LATDPEARVRFPALPEEKKIVGLERGPPSLMSTTEELLDRNAASPVQKTENMAVGIRHADHMAPSIRKSWQHFTDKRRSLLRYSSLADSDNGVFFSNNFTFIKWKWNICEEIYNILRHELQQVSQNLFKRIQACITAEGKQLKHLL